MKKLIPMLVSLLLFCSPGRADVMERMPANMPPPQPIEKVTDIFEIIQRSGQPGATGRLESILKAGANPDQTGQSGFTPLMWAIQVLGRHEATEIRENRYDAVLLLLKYGAHIDAKGRDGRTALHIAAEQNDINVTYLLLEKGADINAASTPVSSNQPGLTSLDKCIPFGPDVFNILLHKGATYDVTMMLDKLVWWHDTGEIFLEQLLARPVDIPESYKTRITQYLHTNSSHEGASVLSNIQKHMELMAEAKKMGQPPKLLFKLQPPFPQQTVPPLTDPPLIIAVRSGDLALVKDLLAREADVNAVSAVSVQNPPTSALHIALADNKDDIAALLIDHGANVNWRNAQENTPLMLAAKNGHLSIIRKLLDKGADANKPAQYLNRPLDVASDTKVMDLLIQHGAEVNYKSRFGSLMQTWVGNQKMDVVAYLLSKGADINIKNYEDRTPLLNLFYWQSMSHQKEADASLDFIKFLVEHGADVKAKDRQDFTAYDWAVKINRHDIADYLQQGGAATGNQKAAFHDAVRRGDVDTIAKLLDQGFNPNTENYVYAVLSEFPDYTVQNYAGGEQKIPHAKDIVYLLARHGADLKAPGMGGNSVLHVTTDPELIDFFVAHGVDVNSVDDKRYTPLHVMARAANVEAVRALLKNKAYPNARIQAFINGKGETPLDMALQGPSDQRPADGGPPDFTIAGPKYLAIIKLLVDAGADTGDYVRSGITIKRWAGGDTAEGYKEFDRQALEIMKSAHAPVAEQPAPKVPKIVHEIPYQTRDLLFYLVSAKFMDAKYIRSQSRPAASRCNIAVMDAARRLYAANPDAAKDFKEFLNTVRWSGRAGGSLSVMGVSPDPRIDFARDYTLLHMAAYYNDPALVKELLAAGADAKSRDVTGNTPLHYSTYGIAVSEDDRSQTLQLLLDAKADINARNYNGKTALLTQYEIDKPGGVIPNSVNTKTGKAAVETFRAPNIAPIKYLVGKGADIRVPDYRGKTLLDALLIGTQAINLLRDSDHARYQEYMDFITQIKAQGGQTHLAGINPATQEVEVKTSNIREMQDTPLTQAAHEENLTQVETLLKNGAAVTEPGYLGETALSMAVAKGNLELVKLLLKYGADLQNAGGHSPDGWDFIMATQSALTIALNKKNYSLVNPLLDLGAKPSAIDIFNMLQQAQTGLNQQGKEVLQLLIDHGVDVNVCNIQGQSLIGAARSKHNEEATEIFLQNGVSEEHCPKDADEHRLPPHSLMGQIQSAIASSPPGQADLVTVWKNAAPVCYDAKDIMPDNFRMQLMDRRWIH